MLMSPEKKAQRLIKQTRSIPEQFRKAAADLDKAIARENKRYKQLGAVAHTVVTGVMNVAYRIDKWFTKKRYARAAKANRLCVLKFDSLILARSYERFLNGE